MATRKETIDRSARQLAAVGIGETLSPEDFDIIATVYDGLHERLLQLNKIYWSDSDCVPLEAEGLIVSILSGTVITEDNDFGLANDEIQKITLMQDRSEIMLKQLMSDIPTGEVVKACYF